VRWWQVMRAVVLILYFEKDRGRYGFDGISGGLLLAV
jgi:hypothetical protein